MEIPSNQFFFDQVHPVVLKDSKQLRFWQSRNTWILSGLGVLLFILAFFLGQKTTTPIQSSAQIPTVSQSRQTINKSFTFPINDSHGTQVAQFTYTIQSAQLQNQIILQGQPAQAAPGRTFLIFNISLTNNTQQTMQINSRDYIRVSIGKSSEMLAPEIYNDPLTVQAISTKYSRVGMPVDASIQDATLHVGTISGQKTTIPLHLR